MKPQPIVIPIHSDDLGFRQFRTVNAQRRDRWHEDIPWTGSDWMTATVGELGEAANIIKKLNRARDGMVGKNDPPVEELRVDLKEELADVATYLDLLAAHYGIDLAAAVAAKFNNVSVREGFPERLPVLQDEVPDDSDG